MKVALNWVKVEGTGPNHAPMSLDLALNLGETGSVAQEMKLDLLEW